MNPDNYTLIEECKRGESQAHEWLYINYSPMLLSICFKYIKSKVAAEDILHESFITIYAKIKQLKENEAIVGWMKTIVVNKALQYLKKSNTLSNIEEVNEIEIRNYEENKSLDIKEQILQLNISHEDMIDIINNLPMGFRSVFNLYAFENFKHDEIAKELGISSGTSRSQLVRARKLIQKKLYALVEKTKMHQKERAYFDFDPVGSKRNHKDTVQTTIKKPCCFNASQTNN